MMQLSVQHGNDLVVLNIEPDGEGGRVRLPSGDEHQITVRRLPGDVLQITAGPRTFRVPWARTGRGIELSYAGEAYVFIDANVGRPKRARAQTSGTLLAPMLGVVADVLVEQGQTVEPRQPLVVIESMKVFANIEAPFAGTVKAIYVQKRQRVEQNAPVVDIAPAEEGGRETT